MATYGDLLTEEFVVVEEVLVAREVVVEGKVVEMLDAVMLNLVSN